MKRIVVYSHLFFLILLIFNNCDNPNDFPILKGPYLGQKPPSNIPELFASGIISTDKRELNSVFSPKGDEFYFAIYTPEPTDKCVIMCSKQVKGVWTEPEIANFSGNFIDVDMAFSPDGNRLYFCSIRSTQSRSVPEPKHDIWFCDRLENNNWSEPKEMGELINSSESETYPSFTKNGRMYFSSSCQGGYGNKDIYYSQKANGAFSKPVNIGSPVNTQYDEGDTFVAPDESYLIISSRGRPDSIGRSDLYISFKKKDGNWTEAKNIGKPINTEVYEYSPFVSTNGKYLFFSRFSESAADIYWVKANIIEEMKREILK